jgi:hypothetical protein
MRTRAFSIPLRLPLPLSIWITKGDADEPMRNSPPGWLEHLKRGLGQ